MMLVESPWPVTTSAPGPSSVERRQRTSTWPCASSPADTALISYSVSTGRQPRTGSIASSTAANSAFTGPLPVASDDRSSPATVSETPAGGMPPCEDVTLQPSSARALGHLGGALLDERQEVRVGDLLLGVGEGDRGAVERVERLAVDVVTQLPELALEAAPAGELADRQAGCRPDPTDWGVMIS